MQDLLAYRPAPVFSAPFVSHPSLSKRHTSSYFDDISDSLPSDASSGFDSTWYVRPDARIKVDERANTSYETPQVHEDFQHKLKISPKDVSALSLATNINDMDLDELRLHVKVIAETYGEELMNKDKKIAMLQEMINDLKRKPSPLPEKSINHKHQSDIQSVRELNRCAVTKIEHPLTNVTKKMHHAFGEWQRDSFKESELCDNLEAAASELQRRISKDVQRMKNDDELMGQFRGVIETGGESLQAIYKSLWSEVEMNEDEGIEKNTIISETIQKAIEDSKKAGYKPRQNCQNFPQLYQSYAITVEKFNSEMDNVADMLPGVSWKLSPPKKAFRFTNSGVSSATGYARVLDIGRGSFQASSMYDVCEVKMAILNLAATRPDVWIIRAQDGFTNLCSDGWRNDLMNMIILCDGVYHIYEIQFCHATMLNARKPVAQILMNMLQRNSLSITKLNS